MLRAFCVLLQRMFIFKVLCTLYAVVLRHTDLVDIYRLFGQSSFLFGVRQHSVDFVNVHLYTTPQIS